jgi:DNA-binding NarL/FixJ family response regulator
MEDTPRPLFLLLVVALAIMIIGGATDVWLDGIDDLGSPHTLVELAMMAIEAGCLWYFWRAWRASTQDAAMIRRALAVSEQTVVERQAERDRWRASAEQSLEGLGRAIDDQFTRWGLTAAEREVALLLLRGLGHKQIAAQTDRSERTVRQHAVVVYGKAGVAGRAELAAYFLQDLVVPTGTAEPARR